MVRLAKKLGFVVVALSSSFLFHSVAHAAPSTLGGWTDTTTAAAAAYCMAKHPAGVAGTYTPDGYEYADASGTGGIVGAVRRDFVAGNKAAHRNNQSCAQACEQLAYRNGHAASLRRNVGGAVQADGIGDFASDTITDTQLQGTDLEGRKKVVAGVWGHPNNALEDGVGQADLCCCHVSDIGLKSAE